MKVYIYLTLLALVWIDLTLSLPVENRAILSERNPEDDTVNTALSGSDVFFSLANEVQVGPAVYGIYQIYKTYGPPAEAAAEVLEKRQPVDDTVSSLCIILNDSHIC